MKLKNRQSLMITLVEGGLLISILFLGGLWKNFEFNFLTLPMVLLYPFFFRFVDDLIGRLRRRTDIRMSVEYVVAIMGGVALYEILVGDLGNGLAIFSAFSGFLLFWLLFSLFNKNLFLQKEEK